MKKKLQLWLICGVFTCSAFLVHAQTEFAPPMPPSPVDQFRSWLEGGDEKIQKALAEYPPEKRAVLQSKLKEYGALPPGERERRLVMIELRHYLQPLMQIPAENRGEKLKIVPPALKPLVIERLKQWDSLDEATQKAVLESEWASRYFVRLQTARPHERQAVLVNLTGKNKELVETKLAQWKQLPMEERARRYKQFNSFFELPPNKKEKALGHLTDKERAEMEKTLRTFDQLSPQQRSACIASFRKFANMSPEDRAMFLKNAERWKHMPSEDRHTWSKLVQSVPPLPTEMPPLPMDALNEPPMPGK